MLVATPVVLGFCCCMIVDINIFFFGVPETFRILGHAIVYFRLKANIFKASGFLVTILAPLFMKRM